MFCPFQLLEAVQYVHIIISQIQLAVGEKFFQQTSVIDFFKIVIVKDSNHGFQWVS